MAQPPNYTRQYNFTDYATTNPSDPLPGVQVDGELNKAKLTLDALVANIGLIQRDDGLLANASVHKDAFDTNALALIGLSGYTNRGNWATGVSYAVGDLVNFNSATYLATVGHTSSSAFATDTATKWILLANGAINTTSYSVDKFEGTGSQTAFTLSYSYSSTTDVLVFVNGALKNPTDDYTISGTTLTFVAAPSTPAQAGNENVIMWGGAVVAEAAKAAAAASASNASGFADEADNWARKTTGLVESTDYSSKAWAIGGTGVTNTASKGAAKEWATKTSGTVDGTDYSSKYWATSVPVTNVSTNIGDVTTVAGQISPTNNIATVAGKATQIATLAGLNTEIGNLSPISAAISGVNTISSAVAAVNTNSSNINHVAGVNAEVTTVAGQISPTNNIATVAGKAAEITTLAGLNTEIGNLSPISAAISGVNTISAAVTAVNTNAPNINNVAAQISPTNNISTLAGLSTEISALYGIRVAVSEVAAIDSNITAVATNIAAVNSFSDQYKTGNSNPYSSPSSGDLWFDTSSSTLKVYGSSGFQNAGSTVNGTSARYDYVVGTNSGTYTSGSTTVFPGAYDVGFVDVYLNGTKLAPSDFTATNGTSITLAVAAATGDDICIVGYGTFQVATALAKSGGTMTGNIVFNSTQTFDGRDVSADGTKLDGIEAAATADQTNAEIRALVESATDSNVFTDADHTKLNDIEASATADQTDAEIKTAVENATNITLGGSPTTTTQSASDNSTKVATTEYVTAAVAGVDLSANSLLAQLHATVLSF